MVNSHKTIFCMKFLLYLKMKIILQWQKNILKIAEFLSTEVFKQTLDVSMSYRVKCCCFLSVTYGIFSLSNVVVHLPHECKVFIHSTNGWGKKKFLFDYYVQSTELNTEGQRKIKQNLSLQRLHSFCHD